MLSGGLIGAHIQMGIGDGLIPEVLDQTVYDDIAIISDEEARLHSPAPEPGGGHPLRHLRRHQHGGGAEAGEKLGPGKTVVTVLPDTGERYFTTPLFED